MTMHHPSPDRWANATVKHVLLPVWIAAYRHKGETYRVVINGQTGELRGDRPFRRRTWSEGIREDLPEIRESAVNLLLALSVAAVLYGVAFAAGLLLLLLLNL